MQLDKNKVKLTESQFNNIIKRSVKKTLLEMDMSRLLDAHNKSGLEQGGYDSRYYDDESMVSPSDSLPYAINLVQKNLEKCAYEMNNAQAQEYLIQFINIKKFLRRKDLQSQNLGNEINNRSRQGEKEINNLCMKLFNKPLNDLTDEEFAQLSKTEEFRNNDYIKEYYL